MLIDHENNNRGLVDTREALELAQSVDLDLVVVSQDKDTPVAKILNYGKLQYQKKNVKARVLDPRSRKYDSVQMWVRLTTIYVLAKRLSG